MKKFKLKLVDLDGRVTEKEIDALICKTPLGEISILANHAPLITVVNKGNVKIKIDDKFETIELIEDALLEVVENEAKLICFSTVL